MAETLTLEFSADGEKVELQLLVTDEKGLIKAESRQFFPLGHALDLLARLPLPLSPRAQRWLKDPLARLARLRARPCKVARSSLAFKSRGR